mmetsp:Transcript_456/g.1507  ORF Transcript_456/g.1507 Transcript_456/m.1507 type:complete len:720 (-) Transcript_456:50-2209(-)
MQDLAPEPRKIRAARLSVHSIKPTGHVEPAHWMSPLCRKAVEVNDVLRDEDFQQEYVLPLGGVLRGFRLAERNKNVTQGLFPVAFLILFILAFTTLFPAKETFEVNDSIFQEIVTDSIAMEKYGSPRSFMQVASWEEFWDWADTILFEKAYNASGMVGPVFTIARYNRVLTPVRFRQVRVKENQCGFSSDGHALSRPCWGGYSRSSRTSLSSFVDTTQLNITGSRYISGGLSTLVSDFEDGHNYGDSGHVVDLELDFNRAYEKLTAMSTKRWTDEYTRAVSVEINTYNPNHDLASVLRLIMDQTEGGKLVPSVEVCSCKLDPYSGGNITAAIFQCIMFLVYLKYVADKLLDVYRDGLLVHFKRVYNLGELIYLVMFAMMNIAWADFFLDGSKDTFDRRDATEFQDLLSLCRKSRLTAQLAAITLLWSFVHAFKHFQAYRSLALTWEVLAHSTQDVIPFMLMLGLAAGAFGLAGHWAFGPRLYDFHTWSASTILLIRTIVNGLSASQRQHGRGELYNQMKEAQPVFAPMWASVWIVLCTLIFFNMFIAIITNSFIFVSQRNRSLAELEERYPMPSWYLYVRAKLSWFHWLWREPEMREQIDEFADQIATWEDLFKGVSRLKLRQTIYELVSKGSHEFHVTDAQCLFPHAKQGHSWRKAISWMLEVSDKTGLKMVRHKHKHSTTFQIQILTDKVSKLEEEAIGLTMQLRPSVPERLMPEPI